ncbi:HNH endonuclease [Gordonia sp. DT219]|uniref:HNH endonuclease n=1 Tax=Gordonia sp. DT219 TaxID=3416658 RepID=UPI003CF927A4
MPSNGQTEWSRQASRRRRIRDRYLARARNTGLDCAFCHQPIDPNAPHLDPGELTIDHIVPLSAGGAPFDASNLAPAHRHCNRQAGDKRGSQPAAEAAPSGSWQLHPDGSVPTQSRPLVDAQGGRTWYEEGRRVFETGRRW